MHVKDLVPDITTDNFKSVIEKEYEKLPKTLKERLHELHKELSNADAVLEETKKIANKTSYLSKSQRDILTSFYAYYSIKLIKDETD